MGLHVEDLKSLTIGIIYDMMIERDNDECKYPYKATQRDFDKF